MSEFYPDGGKLSRKENEASDPKEDNDSHLLDRVKIIGITDEMIADLFDRVKIIEITDEMIADLFRDGMLRMNIKPNQWQCGFVSETSSMIGPCPACGQEGELPILCGTTISGSKLRDGRWREMSGITLELSWGCCGAKSAFRLDRFSKTFAGPPNAVNEVIRRGFEKDGQA